MKRQLLLSLTLSMLASTAFALPAADQATPQVKAAHSVFSQTVAEGGSDRLLERNKVAADGYDRTGAATFAADGYDRTGAATFAADGYDRTGSATVTEDGYDRTGSASIS